MSSAAATLRCLPLRHRKATVASGGPRLGTRRAGSPRRTPPGPRAPCCVHPRGPRRWRPPGSLKPRMSSMRRVVHGHCGCTSGCARRRRVSVE
eukprot:3215812-Amphidinium_carterae.2